MRGNAIFEFERRSLLELGIDVTAEECMRYWKQFYRDVEISQSSLELAQKDLHEHDPAKAHFSKFSRAKLHLRFLLTEDYGRRALAEILGMSSEDLAALVDRKL